MIITIEVVKKLFNFKELKIYGTCLDGTCT